jgi:hypothetical protein
MRGAARNLFWLSEPLGGIRPSVRTARPTTRATLPPSEIFGQTTEMIRPCLYFFDIRHEADPLVAREWRQSIPDFWHTFGIQKYLPHIGW